MRDLELIEKALNLVREASPNDAEQNGMRVYNKFFEEINNMELELQEFKTRNPNHALLDKRVVRLELMRQACIEFMQTYFKMLSYKDNCIKAQADAIHIHSKYEDVKSELKEFELSNKLEDEYS